MTWKLITRAQPCLSAFLGIGRAGSLAVQHVVLTCGSCQLVCRHSHTPTPTRTTYSVRTTARFTLGTRACSTLACGTVQVQHASPIRSPEIEKLVPVPTAYPVFSGLDRRHDCPAVVLLCVSVLHACTACLLERMG